MQVTYLAQAVRTITAAATAAALFSSAAPTLAANLWQPLCPDRTLCATATEAFVTGGRVLMSSSDALSIPSQWVTIDTLHGMSTAMREVSVVTSSEKYLGARGSLFSAYDSTGTLLYSGNHSSFEAWLFFEKHATQLGPTIAFAGTSPATILTGLTAPNRSPTIYLSRDEGQTVSTQTANIPMQGDRTNFVVSANGQRVWVIPGPVTPGLWQTPIASGAAQLDFTKLMRVDDGTFPDDVVQFRMITSNLLNPGGYAVALAKDGMYISTNFGKTWSKAQFEGAVDDIAFPAVTSADTQVIAARGTAFVSRDRGVTWVEMGGGLPADHYTLTPTNGGVVADGVGGVFVCGALDCGGKSFGKVVSVGPELAKVTEFHNTVLDHYFITWVADEIAKLDVGTVIKGWKRTGKSFPVYTSAQSGTSPVCRYYIPPGLGDSHFFGRGTVECNATGQKNPSFVLEDANFMHVFLPAAGVCPAATLQVYRVFSNRPDANHRYMTEKAVRDQMVSQGWLAEGDGPDLVVMCAPQ